MRLLALSAVQLCSCCSSTYPYIFDEMRIKVCQEFLSSALFREVLIGMGKVIKTVFAVELKII